VADQAQDLAALKAAMKGIADGFGGTLGYSLHHRGRGEGLAHGGEEPFPTASTIKTAIMGTVMHQVDAGHLRWEAQFPAPPASVARQEGGYSFFFPPGTLLPLPQWLDLMITMSDNTATMVLREVVGHGNVNRWLAGLGLTQTKLLNGPQKVELGLLPLQQHYGLGMTTPSEMGRLLEMIRDGEAASPAACDRMLRLLAHQYWDSAIAAEIPPSVQVAHKTGAIDGHRSDTAYVFAPGGEYALTVFTKDQRDDRWTHDNEGLVAIRALSRLVWRHYHPQDPWTPPLGAAALWPPEEP